MKRFNAHALTGSRMRRFNATAAARLTPDPVDQTVLAGTLTNPPVSMRLGEPWFGATRPFLNAFKICSGWNMGMTYADAVTAGYVTEGGKLYQIPSGQTDVYAQMLRQIPAGLGASGRWRLRWSGTATINLPGAQNINADTPNELTFDYTANGSNSIYMVVSDITSGPIENISLVHLDDVADYDAGKIYRQAFLDDLRNYRCIYFADWVNILVDADRAYVVTDWSSRPTPDDEYFYRVGVPLEYQAALCNEIGADGWFCAPIAATTDYFQGSAALLQTLMPAPRHVYAEYSTKTWDFAGTPQAHYCRDQGEALFSTTSATAYMEWYGLQATQMGIEFKNVWGASNPRLHVVAQHQADEPNTLLHVMEPPLWQSTAGANGVPAYTPPASVIDMIAVHAQIDAGMSFGQAVTDIDGWRTTLTEDAAFDAMRDQMIYGASWTSRDGYEVTRIISNDSLSRDMTDKWTQFRTLADGYGCELGCYEAGNHLNGVGGSTDTRDFVAAFSVSAQMGEVYTAILNALRNAGFDGPICMSQHVRPIDTNSVSGISRYLGDHNPAWAAIDAVNQLDDGPAGRGDADFVGDMEILSP